ncbi:MAG: hypothetical protein LC734_11285 [Acidobacteria bacterium]|nr:hypothetical protein [Acidobacteriota bacterium]
MEATRVSGVRNDERGVSSLTVRTRDEKPLTINADLFVDATGRARALSKLIERRIKPDARKSQNAKLVGFKAHFRNADVAPGTCDIYSFRGGYGGISPVEKGLTNHCFLARSSVIRAMSGNADRIVSEIACQNPRAAEILRSAERARDWLAVSVDEFGLKKLSPAANVFNVGDSAAFIDPFTGSGMLMALEGSRLFDGVLTQSRDTRQIAAHYESGYRHLFAGRLLLSSIFRRAAFSPSAARFVVAALTASSRLRRGLARGTRR